MKIKGTIYDNLELTPFFLLPIPFSEQLVTFFAMTVVNVTIDAAVRFEDRRAAGLKGGRRTERQILMR